MDIMSREDIGVLLRVEPLGRLGLTDGRRPYVIPMPFYFDGESVYFLFRLGGRKHLAVQANHRACFELDWSNVELEEFCSVLVEGRMETVRSPEEKRRISTALLEKYRPPAGADTRSVPVLAQGPGVRLLKLVPDGMSGRRSRGSTLDWLALAADNKLWAPSPSTGN